MARGTGRRDGGKAAALPAGSLPLRADEYLMDADRWTLIGREAACEAIASTLRQDPPRSVVFAGPAGVGRTRMAREALTSAQQLGRPTWWAAATVPSARVPLGALAHLIPTVDAASEPLVLLQQATRAIVGDGTGKPPVLAVDDVHLLDQLSITLLHQLVAGGLVTLVLTVCTGTVAGDPAAPLWKDGLARRVELQPLSRAQADRLTAAALGGDVATRTGERLWRLTLGRPLFLRELLEEGLRSHRLRMHGRLWRWDGPMATSQRLAEIVLAHVGELDAEERHALEVLATSEPLPSQQLVELSSPEAVSALERRGLVVDDGTGSDEVRAAHPLYSAVVRCQLTAAAQRLIRRRLVDGPPSPRNSGQLVRRCITCLDTDSTTPEPGLLTDAARSALAQWDFAAAERLARAAGDEGAGIRAALTLVEATRWLGDPERSRCIAAATRESARKDEDRSRLAVVTATTLLCGLGRAEDAATVLCDAASVVESEPGRALLTAADALVALLSGDVSRAVRQGTSVLSSVADDDPARLLAGAAVALSWALSGRPEQALATAEAVSAALDTASPDAVELPLTRVLLAHAEVVALHMAGRMQDMLRRAAELRRDILAMPESAGDAVAGLLCGWAALAAGCPHEATRSLAEAWVDLQRRDPVGLRGLCRSLLTTMYALVGEVGTARDLADSQMGTGGGDLPLFDPIRGLAQARLAAAEDREKAAELALEAAALAGAQGQSAVQGVLLHRAARYGRAAEVSELLRALAERMSAPLIACLAADVEAAVADDGERQDQVSSEFEQMGALLLAADAAVAAAASHERNGARRSAAESTARAMRLARACEMGDSPALDLAVPSLTAREWEVALAASRGLSNQDIAARLVVSVRTVETHLSHVYAKLGISSRAGLVAALSAAGPAPDPAGPAPDSSVVTASAGFSSAARRRPAGGTPRPSAGGSRSTSATAFRVRPRLSAAGVSPEGHRAPEPHARSRAADGQEAAELGGSVGPGAGASGEAGG